VLQAQKASSMQANPVSLSAAELEEIVSEASQREVNTKITS